MGLVALLLITATAARVHCTISPRLQPSLFFKLEKPVSLSFYVFPPSRFVEYCLLFPLSADPCGGGVRWGGGLLTQPSLGVWFSVYFLLAGWSLGVIPIGWSSFLVVT